MDASTEVIWESPPPRPAGVGRAAKYTRFFEALRSNPGKWARMPNVSSTVRAAYETQQRVQRGDYSGTTPGEFEATSRSNDDGTGTVWVRYVGQDAA